MENTELGIPDADLLLTTALRDFFIATNGADMRKALATLPSTLRPDQDREVDWTQAEFAFNRLFIGPMALEAPPFASIYLEEAPLLMGRTTLMVRSIYATMGLSSPWKNTLPDDHVSLELDAALALLRMTRVVESAEQVQALELRRFFLHEHVQVWLPRFCERMENAPSAEPVLRAVAGLLRQWLKTDVARCCSAQPIPETRTNKEVE